MRATLAALLFTVFVTAAPAADLFAGTWKWDAAKSHNNWGQKPAQNMSRTYTAKPGGGYDVKIEGVDSEGKPVSNTLQAGGDAEVPVGDSPTQVVKTLGATHVKSHRVDAHKLVATYYKDGKPVGTSTSVVSGDGHTLTMTMKGSGPDGKKLSGVNVYTKQ